MAHPYHHSLSSVKKWGGAACDYLAIHSWFDASKQITADFRHRALRHHAEGIFIVFDRLSPCRPVALSRHVGSASSTLSRISASSRPSLIG
jgi:hypothetical protein